MGGTATGVAAVGDGVCVAEVSAELLAGCGAVVTIVLLSTLKPARAVGHTPAVWALVLPDNTRPLLRGDITHMTAIFTGRFDVVSCRSNTSLIHFTPLATHRRNVSRAFSIFAINSLS